jgi:hypothetical protein
MAWRDTIHVLFNNTILTEPAKFEDIPLKDWNRQIAVSLTPLKAAGGAAIIHHGSIDDVLGNPNLAAYSADKG